MVSVRWLTAAVGVLACAAVVFCYNASVEAFELAAFTALLAVASAIDIESRRIPNVLVAACALVRVAYLCWLWAAGVAEAGSFVLQSCFGAVVVGAGLLLVSSLAASLSGRNGLGGGDIKLLAVAGLYFEATGGLVVVAVACLLALCGQLLTAFGASRGRELLSQTFPFAPFIALACVIVMLAAGSPA